MLLSTGEVAQILGVSRQHVVDLCERGALRYTRPGKHRRIARAEVDRFSSPQPILTREQEKSRRLHLAVLGQLVTHPDDVLDSARSALQRWRAEGRHRADGKAAEYLREWQALLDGGVDEVMPVLIGTDERSVELRQNSPFAGVLSDQQRRDVLRSFTAHWARTHQTKAA